MQTVKIIISQTTVNQNRTLTTSQSQYILSNDTQKSLLLHQKQAPLPSGNETRGLKLLNLRRSLDIPTRNDNYKWTNEQMNKCKENCVSSLKTSAQDVEQIHWLHISWNRKVQCHQWSPEQKQYQSCLLPTVGLDYTISFVLILCAVAGSFMMELCCAVHTKIVCLRRQWYEYESHF